MEKKRDVRMFSFINLIVIIPNRKKVGGKPKKLVDDRARRVADRLTIALKGQYLFMVYNPINHWMLVVIGVSKKTVFYLDPLNGLPDPDLLELINSSMMIFAAQHSTQKWVYKNMVKQVKVPQQPESSKCGYYVMCFIKDVMEDISVLHNNFYGKEKYNQDEIVVVRNEWAMRVTEVIEDLTAETFVPSA